MLHVVAEHCKHTALTLQLLQTRQCRRAHPARLFLGDIVAARQAILVTEKAIGAVDVWEDIHHPHQQHFTKKLRAIVDFFAPALAHLCISAKGAHDVPEHMGPFRSGYVLFALEQLQLHVQSQRIVRCICKRRHCQITAELFFNSYLPNSVRKHSCNT